MEDRAGGLRRGVWRVDRFVESPACDPKAPRAIKWNGLPRRLQVTDPSSVIRRSHASNSSWDIASKRPKIP